MTGAPDPASDAAKRSAIVRHVNDRIRELANLRRADLFWEFHCECGGADCSTFISLRLSDYDERRRSGPASSILAERHRPTFS